MLIGTPTQPGVFSQAIVHGHGGAHGPADHHAAVQPDVSFRGAAGGPHQLEAGRASVAAGRPFTPVTLDGVTYDIAQADNALIFPGLGTGLIVSRASRVSDGMLEAAATALADMPGDTSPGASLLPVTSLLEVSARVAEAVAAARDEGLATVPVDDPAGQVKDSMWLSAYPKVVSV
jgi:malate dehydrogenase (oxaloacetate-decarboxylating)